MCEEVCRTTVVCFDLVAVAAAAAVQLCRPRKKQIVVVAARFVHRFRKVCSVLDVCVCLGTVHLRN